MVCELCNGPQAWAAARRCTHAPARFAQGAKPIEKTTDPNGSVDARRHRTTWQMARQAQRSPDPVENGVLGLALGLGLRLLSRDAIVARDSLGGLDLEALEQPRIERRLAHRQPVALGRVIRIARM